MLDQDQDNFQIKILLVDDKKENLISLEQLLKEADNRIVFLKATSGQESLKIAFFEDPALILLDVQMPEMDGYEVARLLKGNTKTRHIPIIFVTASNQDTISVLEGYETGAMDYLFKPLNPAITQAKVRSFLKMYLQQKEVEMLTHLVNNSLDLMCIVEANSMKILTINPAWEIILGYRKEDLEGSLFNNFVFCNEENGSTKLNYLLSNNTKIDSFETCVLTKNNERKYILWSFVLQDDIWYCIGKEFTERKNTENELKIAQESLVQVNQELENRVRKRTDELRKKNEELLKINADLDNFIYTASHDLKAPISNIEGLVIALESNCNSGDEAIGMIKMINQSIERFKLVISELTDMAKAKSEIMSDEDEIRFEPMIEEIKQYIQPLLEKYYPIIHEDFSKKPVIKFSKKNLRSILYNLISNSIKYSSPDRRPEIWIETEKVSGYVLLMVRDNGLGINEADHDKVFSMFKRLHDHVEGTGIGMSLVKRIIENRGGKIEFESIVGEGTTFKVFFKE